MLKIGLTGGIASGKSTVAEIFAAQDVPIIDMDVVSREIVEPGQPALEDIKRAFGDSVCLENGHLNRKKLKDIIFSNTQARLKLESILHPRIRDAVSDHIATLESPYCIVVIPLLFETGKIDNVDRILVVDTSKERQITRACQRDNVDRDYINRILDSQVDRQTRLINADDIIVNNDDMDSLKSQVLDLHQKYLDLAPKF